MSLPQHTATHEVLTYPQGESVPALAERVLIVPGVYWLRMPLPFALDHINLWLLRDCLEGVEGWTVVDTGLDTPTTRQAWETLFAHALEGLPILRVVVTHMHPDHIGLADWLIERWSLPTRPVRLWISATDWLAARAASQQSSGHWGQAAADFLGSHGLVDAEKQAWIRAKAGYYSELVARVPTTYRRLMAGQTLRIGAHTWNLIAGHGHAPEHMALYCADAGLMISGDMVLPRISTNVSVTDAEPEGNPLQLYLDSLHAMQHLPDQTWVLPSHGRPFRGLQGRITQLLQHHADRFADLRQSLAAPTAEAEEGISAADVLPVLFKRPLDAHQTLFAMGEAIAHLHALWHSGELHRQQDAAGTWRFSRAQTAVEDRALR